MRRTLCFLVGFFLLLTGSNAGDEVQPVPVRFKNIVKNTTCQLTGVWGRKEQDPAWAHTASFSADGKLALFTSYSVDGKEDALFYLWDVDKGLIIREWSAPKIGVSALAISPDGKRALAALFTIARKNKAEKIEKKPAMLEHPEVTLVLWDLGSGKKLHTLKGHQDAVFTVAFDAQGRRALTGDEGGKVRLWDLERGVQIGKGDDLKGESVQAVAFLPSGLGVSASKEGHINLWNAKGALVRKIGVHAAYGLAVSGDGRRLASLAFDQSLKLWDLKTGKLLRTLRQDAPGDSMGTVALSADGQRCLLTLISVDPVSKVESTVMLYDVDSGKVLWSNPTRFLGITPIYFLPGGKQALIGGGANPFTLWNLEDGKLVRSWGGHKGPIQALAVDGKGNVYSASADNTIKVWSPRGEELQTFSGHADGNTCIALSKDGKRLLSGSADKTLKLWDVKTGQAIFTFTGHEGIVRSVALSADGKWAVSGGDDRTVRLWDVQTGKPLQTLTGHGDGVNGVALTAHGAWIASASDDQTIRLWPLKGNKLDEDTDVKVLEGHKRQVTCVAFSPDGKRILSGSQDQTLKVWDLEGKALKTLPGHKNWVTAVAWPRPGLAASVADDLSVCLWNLAEGQVSERLDFTGSGDVARSLAFAADGSTFLVGTVGWNVLRLRLAE
jgi:WD40 repeat protein